MAWYLIVQRILLLQVALWICIRGSRFRGWNLVKINNNQLILQKLLICRCSGSVPLNLHWCTLAFFVLALSWGEPLQFIHNNPNRKCSEHLAVSTGKELCALWLGQTEHLWAHLSNEFGAWMVQWQLCSRLIYSAVSRKRLSPGHIRPEPFNN